MARKMNLNFQGLSPMFAGGGGSDHIPRGQYRLRISEAEDQQSKAGNPMIRCTYEVAAGDYQGRKIVEYFTINNDIAKRRLMALLLCVSKRSQLPETMELDLDSLKNKDFVANVDDDVQQATDQYPERVTSKVVGYVAENQSSNGQAAAPAQQQAAPAQEQAPAQQEQAAAVATEVAPAQENVQEEAQAVDDLFSS